MSALVLEGWTCTSCRVFNGSMKEFLRFCRACDACRRCEGRGKFGHFFEDWSPEAAHCPDCEGTGKRP